MIRFARSIDYRFRVGYLDGRNYSPLCTEVRDGKAVYGLGGVLFLGIWMVWWMRDRFEREWDG